MLTLTTLKLFETLELAKPRELPFFGLNPLYLLVDIFPPSILGNFPQGPKASEYKKKRSSFRMVLQQLNRIFRKQRFYTFDSAQDKLNAQAWLIP
jgi:hypothetical protein